MRYRRGVLRSHAKSGSAGFVHRTAGVNYESKMKTYTKILKELDWPNIYLVPPEQFEHYEGVKLNEYWGMASDFAPAITLKKGLRGRKLANVIYHEIAHHLFPYRPEWWIECFGAKMAGGGGTGYYANKWGHTIDELPSREKLLKLARRASARFNRKHK